MRLTKSQVDELFALKQAADEAQAAYDAEIKRIREAGPAVYKGTCAALLVEEKTRRTVDNKTIFAEYKIPETVIAAHTRTTPYTQVIFKPVK